MRQAIITKYIGPTNFRGARVQAKCDAKTIYVPWDHALDVEENHFRAAEKLLLHLKWNGEWMGGSLKNEYVFVNTAPPSLALVIGENKTPKNRRKRG